MHRIFAAIVAVFAVAFLPQFAAAATRSNELRAPMAQPAPGMAAIFVVRQPQDSQASGNVSIDGHPVGMPSSGTFFRWDVAPGTHQITTGSDRVTINAQPGEAYYVRYTASGTSGSVSSESLTRIDRNKASNLIAQSKPLDLGVIQEAPAAGGVAVQPPVTGREAPAAGGVVVQPAPSGTVPPGTNAPLAGERSSAQGSATEGRDTGN